MGMLSEFLQQLVGNQKVKRTSKSNSNGSVKRRFEPLWKERNWSKRGDTYNGYYRTRYGSYNGEIVVRQGGGIQFYIRNPPTCIARHSHSKCFFPRGENSYEVHFSTKARNLDTGILAIEKIIREAHEIPSLPKKEQ